MSANKEITQKLDVLTVVLSMLTLICVAVTAGFIYVQHRNHLAEEAKYHPSFERALAQLQELADKGCQVPLQDCRHPYSAVMLVTDAMDRENIEYGTRGVTPDKLDELVDRAEMRIVSQELAYLKAKGGARLPLDFRMLSDVCMQVYATEKRTLLGGNPTDQELKNLLPPGITKVDGCHWDKKR